MRAGNPPFRTKNTLKLFAVALVVSIVAPGLSFGVSADEIPHENYDLVGSNLDVVIALLNSSIGYSELALTSMYNRQMVQVQENLTLVNGLLTPVEQLLARMGHIASSHSNLTYLLPPFTQLSSQEDSFAAMETSLLSAMANIVSASTLATLTGEDMVRAIDAIAIVSSLITEMNDTIDDMLLSAQDIISLTVEDQRPFTDNDLIPLIDRLRDLLNITLAEVDRLVNEEISWSESEPFLLLWLSRTDYYLEEEIRGGGYLFFNGTFAANQEISILMDGDSLAQATTRVGGSYSFAKIIPLNASWLGHHVISATALTSSGQLNSSSIGIIISLIPTSLLIVASDTVISFPERTVLRANLRDVHSLPVANASCYLIAATSNITFVTDGQGSFSIAWYGSELGFGIHDFQAFYLGELPYAASSSMKVSVTVDIPTNVTVTLFGTRFWIGHHVVGNGTLMANGTEPLAREKVTVSIDGVVFANATTDDNGVFAFAIPADSLTTGSHTLRAAFLQRGVFWRYSQAEVSFTVYAQKLAKYPFFPIIPGWGGGVPDTIPYLLFGEYAYFTWLLILALIGITIRILQIRKNKKSATARKEFQALIHLDMEAAGSTPTPHMAEEFVFDSAFEKAAPSNPNERVIWYYQSLLGFLTKKRNISLRKSMTHWEVARMLKALGYPFPQVESVTMLFEIALYSGAVLEDADTIAMSAAFGKLVQIKNPGVTYAG